MSSAENKFANECEIGMKWKVKEDLLKAALQKYDDKIISEIFNASNIPGVKYCLVLELTFDELAICLQVFCGLTQSVDVTFTIAIKTVSFKDEIFNMHFTNESPDGVDDSNMGYNLFSNDDIFDPQKKYFVDGIMEIELSGIMKSRGIKRKALESSLSLAKRLWNSDDKDITIVAENKELKIHKWVLSDKSPVFEAEMKSGFKEAQENKIVITDFEYGTVKIFIDYCYERNITELIDENNALELLQFADKYNIAPLFDQIQNFLMETISVSNVCKIANASLIANAKDLRECCVCFLMKFVLKSTVINDIESLDPEIFKEIGQRCFAQNSK